MLCITLAIRAFQEKRVFILTPTQPMSDVKVLQRECGPWRDLHGPVTHSLRCPPGAGRCVLTALHQLPAAGSQECHQVSICPLTPESGLRRKTAPHSPTGPSLKCGTWVEPRGGHFFVTLLLECSMFTQGSAQRSQCCQAWGCREDCSSSIRVPHRVTALSPPGPSRSP